MTPTELQTLINNEITSNANNEITAEVLRPVLIAMVNQINDLVGNGDELQGYDNVIDALNQTPTQSLSVLSGTTDPNVTPPSEYNVGDFYKRTLSSLVISFWQYNGIRWIEVLSRYQQKLRNTDIKSTSYTLTEDDDIIIYNGVSILDLITLPSATLVNGKIYTIVNTSLLDLSISTYISIGNIEKITIPASSSVTLIARLVEWNQINN